MLTLRQVEDVCLWGKGADQCRFLAEDIQGCFYCIKHTNIKSDINKEVNDFKSRQGAVGVDPGGIGLPLGDNCKGYTFFRHKMQGYDV